MNNSSNAEQLGKIIGAAALEVLSESMEDEQQGGQQNDQTQNDQIQTQNDNEQTQSNNTSNEQNSQNNDDKAIHGRGEAGLGGKTEDGTPLRKDGELDGRSTSPNRGGRGRPND